MLKKVISLTTALIMVVLAVSGTMGALASDDIKISINNKQVQFDQMPVKVNDRVLVPLRGIFETLGAVVSWDDSTSTATAIKGDVEISLSIGNTEAFVSGAKKTLDVPSQLINGRTMVPVRFISESLGAQVDWDGDTSTVLITQSSGSTTAGVPNVLSYPGEKRPVPTEFT